MEIPLLDLKVQHDALQHEVLAALAEVFESQVFIGGPKVLELERKIADLCGCRFAVGASSGTDALLNCMMSLDIGPGDEVITSPFSFFASAGAIARTGARPVFVDIDPRTFNMDPDKLGAAITRRTRAIMPVHLFGQVCDMDPILAVAGAHGLAVVEDSAQSISATYRGLRAGSMGTAGCFSFFPSKNLGGIGDGGMIVTNDEALFERLVTMRNHGAKPKYFHRFVGGNFRLDPVQAAVLLVKLQYLDSWSGKRRANALYYDERFRGSAVETPQVLPQCVSVFNQYVIRAHDRDRLRERLTQSRIGSEIYYPVPLHLQECFRPLGGRVGDLPHAEQACREVLALPVYPELTGEMRAYVADQVLLVAGKGEGVAHEGADRSRSAAAVH